MNLSDLVQRAHATAESKGWHEDNKSMVEVFRMARDLTEFMFVQGERNICYRKIDEAEKIWQRTYKASKIALIMCEGAEAIEAIRKGEDESEEIADILIRCGDYSGEQEIHLEYCTVTKMDFNDTRPYKHNKKL